MQECNCLARVIASQSIKCEINSRLLCHKLLSVPESKTELKLEKSMKSKSIFAIVWLVLGSVLLMSQAPAPAPRQPTVVKHTKRDAAIGAVAGAAIGAATSRNKVKGAIIGGAAGAILGGVIGNNVDKTTKY